MLTEDEARRIASNIAKLPTLLSKKRCEKSMSDKMPRRIEMIFQDAVDNLRFIKQQEWTVTNYALWIGF